VEELPSPLTLHSMCDDPRPAPGRRTGERHLTLFRVGSMLVGDQRHLCLVKNISTGGALIRAYCELREGQPVKLELKEQQPIGGKVSWIEGADTGIAFSRKIDVLGLLTVGSHGPRPRMPRVEVRAFGVVRQGALSHRAVINNISQGGVSAQCSADLEVDGEVTVTLTGLAPQQAVVRWGCSGAYGITFNSVLGLPLLIEWLRGQTATARA